MNLQRRISALLEAFDGRQLFRYLVSGIATVAIYVTLLEVLRHITPLGMQAANAIAYLVATVFNYAVGYYWVFQSHRPHTDASWRFLSICAAGVMINSLYVSMVHRWLGAAPALIALSFAAIWPLISFCCLRSWTFAERSS